MGRGLGGDTEFGRGEGKILAKITKMESKLLDKMELMTTINLDESEIS